MPGTWPKPSASARRAWPGPGTRATCGTRRALLPRIVDLDLRAGRTGDAAAHLREGLHLAVRTGSWFELLTGLSQCGDLCAATGRAAEALTLWAACAAVDRHEGSRPTDPPWFVPRREEQLRQARLALGPGRARAAEDRGAAMSLATAAEYALMLTDPGPPQPAAPGPEHAQRPGTGAGHPGRPGPDQRADRRRAAHQRPHGRLAPGPDPGQDRLPPPRRPDPPGPDRGPGLARFSQAWHQPAAAGDSLPGPFAIHGTRGSIDPCPSAFACRSLSLADRTGQPALVHPAGTLSRRD